MYFDLEALGHQESYRLLVNSIVPRPIALVTTVDAAGTTNAAPFSFFNLMGSDPPILVLGIERRASGALKDTVANIRASGEFAVNLVSEAIAEPMNICATDYPSGVDELHEAGLTPAAGQLIDVPHIAESPASFECTVREILDIGDNRSLIIGNILAMHLADEYYDAERRYVLTEKMGLIGRMHGRGWYVRTGDTFHMERRSLK